MLDESTKRAARNFLSRIEDKYDIAGAILYGSRARGDHRTDSDADLAVLMRALEGEPLPDAWQLGWIAFDVMMDTGILVQAFPIRLAEWENPNQFKNPLLMKQIQRDGVLL